MRLVRYVGLAILLSASALAQANNAYFNEAVQSWQGSNINALIARWGMPDSKISSQEGLTLYIYDVRTYNTAHSGPSQPNVGVHFSKGGTPIIVNEPNTNMTWNRGALSLTCRTAFATNPAGKILSVQTQGNGCNGDANFDAKFRNPAASRGRQ